MPLSSNEVQEQMHSTSDLLYAERLQERSRFQLLTFSPRQG